MAKSQATGHTTLQELFRYILWAEKDYPYDLKSSKLAGIISGAFHLTHNQVKKAFHELERRKLIEVTRNDSEIARVEILDRNWSKAPSSLI